jgi:hypothetical protein
MSFCFQPGLLYFLKFIHPLSVVGCQFSGVGVDCRLYPWWCFVVVGCQVLHGC